MRDFCKARWQALLEDACVACGSIDRGKRSARISRARANCDRALIRIVEDVERQIDNQPRTKPRTLHSRVAHEHQVRRLLAEAGLKLNRGRPAVRQWEIELPTGTFWPIAATLVDDLDSGRSRIDQGRRTDLEIGAELHEAAAHGIILAITSCIRKRQWNEASRLFLSRVEDEPAVLTLAGERQFDDPAVSAERDEGVWNVRLCKACAEDCSKPLTRQSISLDSELVGRKP